MEPPLPEVIAWRFLLATLPFAAWFIWRAWAIRTGRPMGSTPWVWLFAAAALLFTATLVVSTFIHPDTSHARYVPGEVRPDGSVTAGHFEKTPK